MKSFRESLAEFMQNPEFKAEWDALEPEFQAYRAALRASEAQEEAQDQSSAGRISSVPRNAGLQARL